MSRGGNENTEGRAAWRIDGEEIMAAVHGRRAPLMPARVGGRF
jgi:hypothetical protein